ncbi:MAG TPA: 2-phospho-L-lactate guanylyltransferase [Candidatus Dormibacteraeota bacterium]|nr:2-phospho-L-lactate guanylyltransferase [Candidatus Dormibacteraeota bacterium]
MSKTDTWIVVLVKDFDSAKQRLGPALDPKARRALARRNAERAVRAAAAGARRLVVAGSQEVATLAARLGAQAVVEPRQEGQNVAAKRGIAYAIEGGAGAVVLLSSDLPLVTAKSVRELLQVAARIETPAVVAVPAVGRGGTNALYLRPPDAITLHFGADSLDSFRREAETKGVNFLVHQSEAMALDLDEPDDLARMRRAV